jgi:RNA polymerase sigma factor (sigma-70 family)
MPDQQYGITNIDAQKVKYLVEDDKKNLDARSFIESRCSLANLLPTREKVMFRLYYECNLSFKEIGLVFEIEPENVSRRLDRINRMLDNISRDVQRE